MLQCLHENGLFYDPKQLKKAKRVLVQSMKTNSMESSTQYINYGMNISTKRSCIMRYTFQYILLMFYTTKTLVRYNDLGSYNLSSILFYVATLLL